MSERENVCLSPNRASVLIPSPATSGGLLPRLTPPPPSKLISPPPLSATATTPQKARSPVQISPLKGTASKPSRSGCAFPTTEVPVTQTSQIRCPESEIYTSIPNGTVHNCFEGLRPLPRKNTFPLNTNRASAPSPPSPSPSLNPFLPSNLSLPTILSSLNPTTASPPPPFIPPTLQKENPLPPQNNHSQTPPPQLNPPPQTKPPHTSSSDSTNTSNKPSSSKTPSWADKARVGTDKSLKRLAPTEYSESGIPQVTVPDEVFERGAAMLQDYIVGSFFAKMPSYKAIENVLNFLWGKGAKLEIHTNKINRTLLVRIPNQFIRKR